MADEPTLYENDVDVMGWVAELQRLLADHGHQTSDPEGTFGPETARAVTDFQRANECDPDGVVGNETWSALHGREREPQGVRNDPYGNTGAGTDAGDGDADVPQEVVAMGLPPSWSQWTEQQQTEFLTLDDGDLSVSADASEMSEVLAVRSDDGDGSSIA